jgi:hypothetical protein
MLQSIKDAIDDPLTDPTSESIDWVHTAAEIVEGVEVVLAVVTAGGVGGSIASLAELIEGVGAGVAWPVTAGVAAMAGEFAALGLGYAEAARKIKEDRSGIGFAEGVVLGVGKAPTDFVKSRFFESFPEQNNFFPEAGVFAQHYYNAALALGYHNGYELDQEEAEMFWKDLGRGSNLEVVLGLPIPNEGSSENDWRDFYIAAAIQFWKLHIDGQDE